LVHDQIVMRGHWKGVNMALTLPAFGKGRAMWDRLLIDCNIATMDPAVEAPFGAIENGAIAIQDGRILRVGRRTELAGNRAREVVPLGGAWVTPGLVDCHTHLVFGGNRSAEFEQRLGGASYEEIARSGGGIVSTVAATRQASVEELAEAAFPRLRALMRGGVTTIEIKSGYGLDTETELNMLRAAQALGRSESVRVVTTLLALHGASSEYRGDRTGVRPPGRSRRPVPPSPMQAWRAR
jgi:imidazolonepropionase